MCRVIPGVISANKTAETWSHRAGVLAVNSILLVLTSLVAAFQCYGLLFLLLLKERRRQQEMTLQAAHQYNAAVARLRYVRRRAIFRRLWRNCGRTEQWWQNLYNGILPESEWKKNLRMDRDVFIALADEIRPYLQPGRSPRGLDVLSVEKQLALTLYFLKDQGSLSMTANAFGIARCTELFLALIVKYCLLIPLKLQVKIEKKVVH